MLDKIINNIQKFRDSYGIITQADKDGGDSAHRIGAYYTLTAAANKPELNNCFNDLNKLEVAPNTYTRHPDKTRWYSDYRNFSRDQTIQVMCAFAMYDRKDKVLGLAWELLKRVGFHKNVYPNHEDARAVTLKKKTADFIIPSQLGIILRSLNSKLLYPLIALLDVFLLLDVCYLRDASERNRWDYDANLMPILCVAKFKQPTFVSKLAIKLYKKAPRVETYLREYFDLKWNGIPPLGELYCYIYNNVL